MISRSKSNDMVKMCMQLFLNVLDFSYYHSNLVMPTKEVHLDKVLAVLVLVNQNSSHAFNNDF